MVLRGNHKLLHSARSWPSAGAEVSNDRIARKASPLYSPFCHRFWPFPQVPDSTRQQPDRHPLASLRYPRSNAASSRQRDRKVAMSRTPRSGVEDRESPSRTPRSGREIGESPDPLLSEGGACRRVHHYRSHRRTAAWLVSDGAREELPTTARWYRVRADRKGTRAAAARPMRPMPRNDDFGRDFAAGSTFVAGSWQWL